MRIVKTKEDDLREFAAFVTAEPVNPRRATEVAVFRLVEKTLQPRLLPILGKLTLVQATAGVGTLALCPQFEIGFGTHHHILHALHAWTGPLLLNLFCGIFFVLFGAVLAGSLLRLDEIKVLGKGKYLYHIAYGTVALAVFMALGAQVLILGAVLWVIGAALGTMIGLEAGSRLRSAAA